MPELSAEETYVVGEASELIYEEVTVPIVTAPAYPGGLGRLVHPLLGTLDYEIAPDEWVNLDADILYGPVFAHTRTLRGNQSTRWQGYIGDVECTERWNGRVSMRAGQFRMLLDFWKNPPTSGYLIWSPNYVTANSYEVDLVAVTSGGQAGVGLDYLILQNDGFVKGPVEAVYRVKALVDG
jgi:hypothetical protein